MSSISLRLLIWYPTSIFTLQHHHCVGQYNSSSSRMASMSHDVPPADDPLVLSFTATCTIKKQNPFRSSDLIKPEIFEAPAFPLPIGLLNQSKRYAKYCGPLLLDLFLKLRECYAYHPLVRLAVVYAALAWRDKCGPASFRPTRSCQDVKPAVFRFCPSHCHCHFYNTKRRYSHFLWKFRTIKDVQKKKKNSPLIKPTATSSVLNQQQLHPAAGNSIRCKTVGFSPKLSNNYHYRYYNFKDVYRHTKKLRNWKSYTSPVPSQ